MAEMADRDRNTIEMRPIGFVSRALPDENERDRSLVAKIVFDNDIAPALEGIDRVRQTAEPQLCHQSSGAGIFAARSPIHPNPIGLTLVELVKREGNELWVRGLDAYDGTPVMDVKPYPDWEHGRFIVVTDFEVPGWLTEIMERQENAGQAGD